MILQLDIGNTRLKWRSLGDEVFAAGACNHEDFELRMLGELSDLREIQIASVSAQARADALIACFVSSFPQARIYQAKSAAKMGGVQFSYQVPEAQGVDRCLAMVAAYRRYSASHGFSGVMVIDAGSALTVDVLDEGGRQVEGYIAPGLGMMRNALLSGTSNIAGAYDGSRKDEGLLTTRICVDRGVHKAFISFVRHFVDVARASSLELLLTGGDAPEIEKAFPGERFVVVDDLVFEGLELVAAQGGV